MKINRYIIYLGIAILPFAISCKKNNLTPYDQIALDQSFQKVSDANKWDTGLYGTLRSNSYGIFTYTTDVQADQLNATLDYGNRNGFPHRWTPFLSDDYSLANIWSGYYYGLTNINRAIQGFATITPANDAEKASLNQYTGDMYLARAYYYFNLLQRWSKAYNPTTASTDMGVPLLLTYDIEAKPSRASVKEVVDQILKDLAQAKSLLSNISGAPESVTFNADVVTALSARINLYLQNWTQAEADAEQLIKSGVYPLINTQAGLKNMWTNDKGTEIIFQCNVINNTLELPNTNSIYLGYNGQTNYYTPDFLPAKWMLDSYADNDFRKSVYFTKPTVYIQGNNYTEIYVVNKFPGNPTYFTSQYTNYVQRPKLFRIAEMYLISAEAAANLGNSAQALVSLNALRASRGLNVALSVAGQDLVNAVRDERSRELAFEGFRLDDLKRWHLGFQRHGAQNESVLSAGAGYYTLGIAADADKFTWGIPTNDITVNTNLKQNPGW